MVSSRILIFSRISYFFPLLLFVLLFAQSSLASTIGGNVYDQNRNALSDVDVELLNENYQVRDRTRTNGVGRYQFNNITDGHYYVKVLPFRYDVEDDQQYVEVNTFSIRGGTGNSYFPKDFYLAFKKGGLGDTTTGVIFAQEVPKEAEKFYKTAKKEFAKDKQTEGITNLLSALKIFPEYFYALQRLGTALYARKQHLEATQAFMQSVNVNPKSSTSYYYMGLSLNKLGSKYNKASLVALNKAAVLAPASVQVAYALGKIQRQEGKFKAAEKNLLRAKKLSKIKSADIHKELAELYGNDLKEYGKAADELELYLKASKKKDEATLKIIADLRAKAKKGS